MLTARWWRALGISSTSLLKLNSIGSLEARANYRDALVAFLKSTREAGRRLQTSHVQQPLRVLDSKIRTMQALLNDAPALGDYLDDESREALCWSLQTARKQQALPIPLISAWCAGLDYYNRTVFEWVTTSLGSQGTVCAGGRYDGLVEQLSGRAAPAVGLRNGP